MKRTLIITLNLLLMSTLLGQQFPFQDTGLTSFEFFDRASGRMDVIPGEYEVFFGSSSDSKDLKTVNIMIR
jgi:hypothetical protein